MGAHYYACETGGQMLLSVEGTPPRWATCAICPARDCDRCEGAQLDGDAPSFVPVSRVLYQCEAGHQCRIAVPAGTDGSAKMPETAGCPECSGMLKPIASLPL